MKLKLILLLAVISGAATAQVGIGTNTPHPSAQLEVQSANKGLLIPRVSKVNRPSSPAVGLLIYQTDETPGFYQFDGTSWERLVKQSDVHRTLIAVQPAAYTDVFPNQNTGYTPTFTVPWFSINVDSPDFVYETVNRGFRVRNAGVYLLYYYFENWGEPYIGFAGLWADDREIRGTRSDPSASKDGQGVVVSTGQAVQQLEANQLIRLRMPIQRYTQGLPTFINGKIIVTRLY